MVLEAEIADRIELVLESIAGEGAAILTVSLMPGSWEASYRLGSPRTERYVHRARLSLLEGEATAALLTPVLSRRWNGASCTRSRSTGSISGRGGSRMGRSRHSTQANASGPRNITHSLVGR